MHRAVAAGQVEVLAPRIAVRPLGDADQRDVVHAEIGQTSRATASWPGAAVDQHEIGPVGKSIEIVVHVLGRSARQPAAAIASRIARRLR